MSFLSQFYDKKGKVYSQRPGQFSVTFSVVTQVVNIKFYNNLPFTYFYYRSGPASGSLTIYGDEFGPRAIVNEINAVGLISVSNVIGAPVVNRVINAFTLDGTNNIHMFTIEPWRTSNLYLQCGVTGSYLVNYSYIF